MPPRSRQTRNQEAVSRRAGQVLDLDPTDGLPVQKYAFQIIQINQDASSDPSVTNTKSTNSAEWAAQFNTPQYPWPEPALPSFIKELQPWNQEMIRRARAGNTVAKLSVWDRKDHAWLSAAEAGKRLTPLKSIHLNNLESSSNGNGKLAHSDVDSTKSHDGDEDSGDSSSESNKSADEDEEDDAVPFKPSTSAKRRKLATRLNGPDDNRTIDVRKWVQLPASIADKAVDRTFLAARRPGMPPLYHPDYAQRVFGQYHSSATLSGSMGYDPGDGGGLNSSAGVLGTGTANAGTVAATPARRNIPPRRKKKKLGGPGRRKANPNPELQVPNTATLPQTVDGNLGPAGSDGSGVGDGVQNIQDAGDDAGNPDAVDADQDNNLEVDGDGDDNESESEAEGSEEGEIDEGGGASVIQSRANDVSPPRNIRRESLQGSAAPEVIVTDAEMKDAEAEGLLPEDVEESAPATDERLPSPIIEETLSTWTAPVTKEIFIPGLGEIETPEEAQTVQETVNALTPKVGEHLELTPKEDIVPNPEQAITEMPAEIEIVENKTVITSPREEMDLLGAMDAAIDRGMSEGA